MWLGAKLWRIKKHLWVTHYQNLTYLNSKFLFLRSLEIKKSTLFIASIFILEYISSNSRQAYRTKSSLKYTPHLCLILLHSGKHYAKLKSSSESNNSILYAIKVWQTSSAFLNLLKKYSQFFTLIIELVLYRP